MAEEALPEDLQKAVDAVDRGDFASAHDIISRALDGGATDVRYLLVAGQAFLYQSDFAGLERVADALLSVAPDMVLAHIWKGDACRRLDNREATFRHYEAAIGYADRLHEIPPAVAAALPRVRAELPTLRRQFGGEA